MKLSERVQKLMDDYALDRREMMKELGCEMRTMVKILNGEFDQKENKYQGRVDSIEDTGPKFKELPTGTIKLAELEKRILTIEIALRKQKIL